MKHTRFILPVKAPFRLDLTIWALKRRGVNRIEHWDGSTYVRVLMIDQIPVKIQISQPKYNRISVLATSSKSIPKLKSKVSHILNKMLGLNVDLKSFYAFAKKNPALSALVRQFKGVKPPRFPTLFEAFVNAIACQQLSLEAAFSLLNQFTEKYGQRFKGPFIAFPEPRNIKTRKITELMKLGFSRHKSEAIIRLAAEIENFPTFETLSNKDLITFLCQIKGIGRWSAEYLLLRGLGRTEMLPGDDVAIHKSIKQLLKLRKVPDYEKIKQIEKKWDPFAGLIYFHLLLKKLSGTMAFASL